MNILWIITMGAALAKSMYVLGEQPSVEQSTTEMIPSITSSPETSCPESGTEIEDMCYWEISNQTEWRQARRRCQNYAGDLVSYQNASEEGTVMRNAEGRNDKIWIGLRRDSSSSDFRWSDGSNLTYTNWAPGEPKANDSTELCVANSRQIQKWEVTDCTLQQSSICKAAKGICGGDFDSDNGTFHSPKYPKSYPPNLRCTWRITVPEGQLVILQFLSFELEDDAHCKLDYVKVVDGHESDSPVLNTFCGERNVGIVHSTKNKMSITFVTDDDYVTQFKGFSAVFMTGTMCSKTIMSGNLNWWRYQGYCYTVYDQKKYTWNLANSFCHNNGAFLASIHSLEELKFLRSLHLKPVSSWIGLKAADINSSYEWVDGTEMDFQNWDQSDENRTDTNICVYLDIYTGLWRKRNCFDTLPAVCKFKENPDHVLTTVPPTPISQGVCSDQWYTFGNKCSQLFGLQRTERKTWREANASCANVGSTLVSIRSKEEQEFLKLKVSTIRSEIWIGMYYSAAEKLFYWADSSTVDFTNWDSNEPHFDGEQMQCVKMNNSDSGVGKWETSACINWLPYICQITKGLLCTRDTCKNGGICTEDGKGGVMCTCQNGYKGLTCEERIICADDTCKNGGSCSQDGINGNFSCSCALGYKGLTCDERIICADDTCKNGGSCSQDGINGNFSCSCALGYKGLTCDERIICADDTCKNGGSCSQDGINRNFSCSCALGYKGLTCDETAVPVHSGRNVTGLELALGIPLAVACSILFILLVRRLRRRKKSHHYYLTERHLEFTNPQTMYDSSVHVENSKGNQQYVYHELSFIRASADDCSSSPSEIN